MTFFELAMSERRGAPVRLISEEIPKFKASTMGRLHAGLQVVRLVSRFGRNVNHKRVGRTWRREALKVPRTH